MKNLNGHVLTHKGNTFYCDGEICGYAMTLSTAQDLKGSSYSKVTTIRLWWIYYRRGSKEILLTKWGCHILKLIGDNRSYAWI